MRNEELRTSVIQRKKDFDNGKVFLIPHEQIKKRTVFENLPLNPLKGTYLRRTDRFVLGKSPLGDLGVI